MDIQAAGQMIDLTIKGITILLMIVAGSSAIKKNNNIALGVAIVGNLFVFYITQSPILCWIVSIACIIWVNSKSQTTQNKRVKVGNIIGIIIGVGLVAGPLIGYLRQEASLKDPTTQGVLILFAVIGGFMIINNLFKLFENEPSTQQTTVKELPKQKAEKVEEKSEEENETPKVRCRFCKKLYSAEYNGCPHCKKK